MTRLFRKDLFARLNNELGLKGIRPAHLHVFANIVGGPRRLTELAEAASMSLSSMQDLVDDLERRGIVERQADASDRRAKLIALRGCRGSLLALWRAVRGRAGAA